jgi:hypothetical protein
MSHRAVYKSSAAEFLDVLFSGLDKSHQEQYAESIDLLDRHANAPLSEAARELGEQGTLRPDVGTDEDLRTYWLDEPGRLAGQHVDRVLRHGYRQAIELARTHDVPIETFWITGAGDEFQVHICESERQVTVFMFVPQTRRYGSTRSTSRSWAVGVGGLRDPGAEILDEGPPPVVKIQTSGPSEAGTAT